MLGKSGVIATLVLSTQGFFMVKVKAFESVCVIGLLAYLLLTL